MVDLRLGNCLDIMLDMIPKSIDLIVTSPPYFNAKLYSQYDSYEAYLDFLREFCQRSVRVLKPNRILAVNLSCVIEARAKRSVESNRLPIPFDFVALAQDEGLKFVDDIIWEKPDGASNRAIKFSHHRRPVAYKPFQVTEYILIFKNGTGLLDGVIRSHDDATINASLVHGEYERTNIWKLSPVRTKGHPASFPMAMAENIIRYYSFRGDTVFDPMMGSGTVGVACLNSGRNFVGIDIDDGYFKLTQNTLDQMNRQGRV